MDSEKKSNIIKEKDSELSEKNSEISELKKREEERKHRNKRIVKGFACLLIVLLLFIFSNYLIPVIGNVIYVIGGVGSIFSICLFFGIDWLKIKLWCKK